MALEFYHCIKTHAEITPDKPAIIDGDVTLSYSDFLKQVEQFAAALGGLNLSPDSKLGILCLNQKEFLVAFLAALLKGVPVIPFNFLLTPEDLVFITRDAGIDTLLVASPFIKPETQPFFQLFKNKILVGPCDTPEMTGNGTRSYVEFLQSCSRTEATIRHQRNPQISDVILYTSGTTARPKGVMLDESQFYENTEGILAHLLLKPEDRAIVALPLFHSFGNIMALVILRVSGTLILLPQFAPKSILTAIQQHKATLLPLVPTIYTYLVELYGRGGYDISSLRYCISGGASLPENLLHIVEQKLGVTVIEGYGLTENSPVISVNRCADGSVPGSVGPVLPNVQIKIVDQKNQEVAKGEVGEILVQGPARMKGYWKRPEETREAITEDGWLRTGDLGHLDEHNRLYISAGRKKDLIIRAGDNISPLAIENALMNHPGVAEAAAVGVPHSRVGEQVKVCVVLREGAKAEAAEIKEFCRKKLAANMIPDIISFYDALPKNATGKVLKDQLRQS